MSTKRQKGKSKKRQREWHHLPNQDRIYRRNAAKLDAALKGDDDGEAESQSGATGNGKAKIRPDEG